MSSLPRNSSNLTILYNEVEIDPIIMGYASVKNNSKVLVDFMNDPDNNVGEQKTPKEFTMNVMLDSIVSADLVVPDPMEIHNLEWLRLISSGALLAPTLETIEQKFRACFNFGSPTLLALDAHVRTLSRPEVLYDIEGLVITEEDWLLAVRQQQSRQATSGGE